MYLSIIKNRFIYTVILASFYASVLAQNNNWSKIWPERVGAGATIGKGYAITKSNDTLTGYFKIFHDTPYKSHWIMTPYLPFNKTKKIDIIILKTDSINFIKVKLSTEKDSVMYENYDADIWQLLGEKNKVKIYLRHWSQDENGAITNNYSSSWDEMILVSDKNKTAIPLKLSRASALRKFINKRCNLKLPIGYFKDEKTAFNYILEKENEK